MISRTWVLVGVILTQIALSGCAISRGYPICLYDTDMGGAIQADAAWPSVEKRLAETLKHASSRGTAVVVNSRMATAVTAGWQDRAIEKYWPSIACFGESGDADRDKMLGICKKYVAAAIRADRKHEPLPDGVIVPPCRTEMS